MKLSRLVTILLSKFNLNGNQNPLSLPAMLRNVFDIKKNQPKATQCIFVLTNCDGSRYPIHNSLRFN